MDAEVSMNDEDKRHDIAVLRFGLSAPVIHGTIPGSAAEYFRHVTEKKLDVPHVGPMQYRPHTLKAWLGDYRAGGFDGLIPQPRADIGTHRVITPIIEARLREIFASSPRISTTLAREKLVDEGLITTRSPSESVIRRFVKREGLRVMVNPGSSERHAFAKSEPNELWTLDFMHGPKLNGSRSAARLLAVIDDASRFIVIGRFLPSEAYADFAQCLVDAFVRHGVPLAICCDNGAAFSTHDLGLTCARLDIALIHSRPYVAQGRGKIERFFLTVRQRFLAGLDPAALVSLEALDAAFQTWLETDYHRRVHSSLDTTPMARFLDGNRPKHWISRQELDLHFHHTLRRKVRSDCTVSVAGVRYEVPPEWIGYTVELRSPLNDPNALTLFAAGKPTLSLKPLDLLDNDRVNRRVSFARASEDEL
jgi:transposase InsO family protein